MSSILSPLQENIVLWLPFSEGSGTTAYDYSGNSSNCTLIGGPSWFKNVDGSYVIDFSGSTQYGNVADNANFSFTDGAGNDTACTIMFWLKHDTLTDFQSPIGKFGGSGDREWYMLNYADGKIYWSLTNSTASAYIGRQAPAGTLTTNTWYHIALTYSGNEANSGVKIYVNGIRVDTTDLSSGTYTGTSNTIQSVTIGQRGDGQYLNGQVRNPIIVKGSEYSIDLIKKHYQETFIQ